MRVNGPGNNSSFHNLLKGSHTKGYEMNLADVSQFYIYTVQLHRYIRLRLVRNKLSWVVGQAGGVCCMRLGDIKDHLG